ncbi:MAG TPA: DinB family protein [Thermoanaerobaculia bacterium]|nr:DinB family protein [Thermoanaerobaculia bacterium]
MRALIETLLMLFLAAAVSAQETRPAPPVSTATNPLSAHNKSLYGGVKRILLRSAEKMPEESYGFRPASSVRSYGEIIGHIAESQYVFCSAVRGDKNPAPKIEKTKTAKAGLIAALTESFTWCDTAYGGLTDTSGAEMVKFMGGDKPKLGVLTINVVHSIEHYGNLVTYMRMKDVVPPTSDPEFMKEMARETSGK